MRKIWCWVTVLSLVLGLCTPLGGLALPAAAEETASGIVSGTYEGLDWSYDDGTLTLSGGPLPAALEAPAQFPWVDYAESIFVVLLSDVTLVRRGVFDGLPMLSEIVFQGDTPPEFVDTTDDFVPEELWVALYCPDTWGPEYQVEPYWFTLYDTDRTGFCGAWQDENETVYGENLTWTLERDTLTISGEGEMADWGLGTLVPWAFYFDEIRRVVIEDGVISVGNCAFGLDSDNRPRSMPDPDAPSYPIETVELGSTVQRLGRYAFARCNQLEAVTIPASAKEMGAAFFECTGLREVNFAPDVKIANLDEAFSGCTGLTSVEIPASDPDYGEGGEVSYSYAFQNCTGLTEATFRDGAMLVDDEMFSGCTSLAAVHLPNSITKVSAWAFGDCESLTDIYYDGYPDQWSGIAEEGWDDDLPAAVTVHCLEDTEAPTITATDGGVHGQNFRVEAYVRDNRPEITVECAYSADGGKTWQAVGSTQTIRKTSGTVSWTVPVEGLTDGVLPVRVTATDSAGNQSTYTVEHILDFTPPEAPTGLAAEAKSSTTVSLTWDMPEGGTDIRLFRVYYSTDNAGFTLKGGPSSNGLTVSGLEPGQTYYFYVTAVDAAGNESGHSATVTAATWNDTTPPSVPVITPASGSTIGPRQTIKVYASDESNLDCVHVELQAGEDTWREREFSLSGKSGSVSFTLEGLESGEYSLRARAADTSGNMSEYCEPVAYTLDATPPTVDNVTAQVSQADSRQVDLSWTSGAEEDLAGFYLYRVSGSGSSTRIGSVSARSGQTSYTFTDRLSWSQCGQSYTYRVTATDRCGNETSAAAEGAVTPQAPADTLQPTAVLTAPEAAFQGDALSFSAAGSSDDRGIVSYAWDFGDGKTASGKAVSHTYGAGGAYTVTLTLRDAAGNKTVKTQTVTVTAAADSTPVTVTVLDQAGAPVRSAQVVYDLGGANTSYYTDSSGRVSFRTADSGAVEIGAYASGYLPGSKTVTLVHGYQSEVTLRLEEAPVVTGTLTSSELTYEEIRDLGIDTSAPENQNVYAFAAEIQIGGNLTEYTYYLNDAGSFVGPDVPAEQVTVGDSDYTIRPHVLQVEEEPEVPGQPPTVETISYVTVLRLPGTVSTLKQFFEAELTVLNQAGAGFSFTGCTAELEIPSGLALVPTAESAESASVILTAPGAEEGEIPGQSSASARWILRGDQPGQYQLEASFDGTLDGFGLPIHAEFQSERRIEVRPASDLSLHMFVSNTMLDRTIYVDLELSGSSTVNLPRITLGDYSPAEIAVRQADGTETVRTVPPATLEPGQTLVYRYVIRLGEDLPLLFACNILEGQLEAGGLTAHVSTRNITKFKLFSGDFGLTELGVFCATLPPFESAGVDMDTDAQNFWKFIFNTKNAPAGDDMYYRILRGELDDYDGTLEELRLWILSLCQSVRARLNCYVTESSEKLGFLTQEMADLMWDKLEGAGVTGGEALRDYGVKKAFNSVKEAFCGIEEFPEFTSMVDEATSAQIQAYLEGIQSLVVNTEDIKGIYDAMDSLVEQMQLAMNTLGIVLESEYTARYAYFNFYLNQRINYAHPGESAFRLLLDAKSLSLKDTYWPSEALDTITWITGTDSWTNHTGEIERWAELLYQLEVVATYYDEGTDGPDEPDVPDVPDEPYEPDEPSHSGGSGGSGGGSSSGGRTETTVNPDGSTTTTVTRPNGAVVETTRNPDGSREVVESAPDGTVTTTVTDKAGSQTETVERPDGSSQTTVDSRDGSGSVTTVSRDGAVEVSVTLSPEAVQAAAETGGAAALPMPEVPVTAGRAGAPTVTVELPAGASVRVEIPVADVTPGTVAVLVRADGSEQVLRTSLTTATGVTAVVGDGDTVKIVDNSKSFSDVSPSYWAADAIAFATSRELLIGTAQAAFSPEGVTTRGQIVTILWRLSGSPAAAGPADFSDVSEDAYYAEAIRWAIREGIAGGYGGGRFGPDDPVTREQLAVMLYRYAVSLGQGSAGQGSSLAAYPDAGQVSGYAYEAMGWITLRGIITGTAQGTLEAQAQATRAQAATVLQRFVEAVHG